MLINFSVENFRSISERQSLILEASSDPHLRHRNTFVAGANLELLKSVALYGSNASGKSNVLGAMIWMRRFVLESLSEKVEQTKVPVETNRLHKDQRYGASVFEIEFLISNERFRYGFAVSGKGIEEEWLFRKRIKGPEARIFTREGQNITPNSRQEDGLRPFAPRTRPNTLFLKVCAEFNFDFAERIMNWFRHFRSVSGLSEAGFISYTAGRMLNDNKRKDLLKFVQKADFNICDVKSTVEPLDETKLPDDMPSDLKKRLLSEGLNTAEIKTCHKIYDTEGNQVGIEEFDLEDDESQGTRKFVAMAGPILHTIEQGAILLVDEFEARLHPKLTKAILDWFHGPQNEGGAQLIIATHDTGLMTPSTLRRDQIWFCEKDRQGASTVYCLDEFDKQDVRATTKFNRQYLEGIFGAVPQVALEEFFV